MMPDERQTNEPEFSPTRDRRFSDLPYAERFDLVKEAGQGRVVPNEEERRPCKRKENDDKPCLGTQIFKRNVGVPGFHAGKKIRTGEIAWEANERRNGWVCDVDADHFDLE